MILGFVHDHVFFQENGITYSGGGLPSSTWFRYLAVFDKIYVMGRRGNKKLKVVSSVDNVEFFFLKKYKKPIDLFLNYRAIKSELDLIINKCDVLIIRLPSVLGLLSAKMCNEIGKPYILEVVGSAKESMMYSGIKGKIFGAILESKMKSIISQSQYVIYVTKDYLQNIYPSKGKTINISNVNIHDLDESILIKRLEKIKNLNDNSKIRIGLVGSINVPYKGHDVLINAINHLNIAKSKVLIDFVGGGENDKLQQKINELGLAECIKIAGSLSAGAEMLNFLDGIDLLIHPSLTEGLPRIVLEAFSRGCPVLGSNAGGIPELLDREYIHEKGNYVELSNQLYDILLNKDILKFMAQNNFSKSEEYLERILQAKRKSFIKEFLIDYETK